MADPDPARRPTTIGAVLGQNVAEARTRRGLSQVELGEAVAPYLGRPWPRQTVSLVEQGRRAFTAEEVLALAHVLQTTPGLLFRVSPDVEAVTIGDVEVARREVQSGAKPNEPEYLLLDLMDQVRDVRDAVKRAAHTLQREAHDPLGDMDARITDLLTRIATGEDGDDA